MIEGTSGQDEVVAIPNMIAVKKILLSISLLFGLSYVAFQRYLSGIRQYRALIVKVLK